jgi:hypothetical protein
MGLRPIPWGSESPVEIDDRDEYKVRDTHRVIILLDDVQLPLAMVVI